MIKKGIIILLFLISSINLMGQGFTYSYSDPCTSKIKEIYIPNTNGSVALSYNGNIRSFTPDELQSGAFQLWISEINSLNPLGPCSGVGLSLNTTLNSLIAQNTISVLTSVLTSIGDISENTSESLMGLSTIEGVIQAEEKVTSNDKKKSSSSGSSNLPISNSTPNSNGDKSNTQVNGTTNNINGNQTTSGGNEGQDNIQTNQNGTQQVGGNNREERTTIGNSDNSTARGEQTSSSSVDNKVNNQTSNNSSETSISSKNNETNSNSKDNSGLSSNNSSTKVISNDNSTSNKSDNSVNGSNNGKVELSSSSVSNSSTPDNQIGGQKNNSVSSSNLGVSNTNNPTTVNTGSSASSNTNNSTTPNTNNSTSVGNNQNSQNGILNNQNSSIVSGNQNSQGQTDITNSQNGVVTTNQGQTNAQSNVTTTNQGQNISNNTSIGDKNKLNDAMNLSATMTSQVKNKVASVKKGSLIMNGDIVTIQNTSDNSQFKVNAGIISSNTKNTLSKGVLLNFTSSINNSCLTLFMAYKHKKLTTIVANSSMLNFDKDFFNTTSLMESYKIKKYTLTVGVNLTTGNLGDSKFQSLSGLGGVVGTYKFNKKISNTTMLVTVYSPYVYYYEGIWYESGFLIVPFTSFDYKITKKFKMNLSFSGVHQINDKTLSYQILLGAKTFL